MKLAEKLQVFAMKKPIALLLKACNSIYFILFYALFTLLSSIFGLEIYFYLVTSIIVLFICLFAEDTKLLFVPVFFIAFAAAFHHAAVGEQATTVNYFQTLPFIIPVIIAGIFALPGFIIRLFFYTAKGNFLKEKFPFKLGLILLTIAFLCNGIFAKEYSFKNLLYAIELSAGLIGVFLFFYHTLSWKKEYTSFIMSILLVVTFLLILQFIWTLFFKAERGFINGSIQKYKCYFGWGDANGLAGVLTMFLPAFYYFAYTKKHGYFYYLASYIVFFVIILSQGRTSIMIACLLVAAAFLFFSIKKTEYRGIYWIIHSIFILAGILVLTFFFDKIKQLLSEIFKRGFELSAREPLWLGGLKNFWHYPLFGAGFYAPLDITDPTVTYWKPDNGGTPYLHHNIIIEAVATFGLLGLIAFAVHLYQLIHEACKIKKASNIVFIAILAMLLLCSIGDIFFFGLYFIMYYAIILLAWTKSIQFEKKEEQPEGQKKEACIAFKRIANKT